MPVWIDDHPKEECGVFGIYGHPEAANMAYLGLYALQHRGQESAGIVASNGEKVHSEVGMGLVADVFTEERIVKLQGRIAIGHNRYSTAGQSDIKNAQPFLVNYAKGTLALGHNGNLVNGGALREELEANGSIFRSTTDSEVILHLIARSDEKTTEGAIIEALQRLEGAYTLTMMTEDKLIGIRDPLGFRPLVLGKLPAGETGGDSWVLASETCALDLIDAEYIREIEPGEMVIIDENGLRSISHSASVEHRQCIFEFIYFARPDSFIFGKNAYGIRRKLGARLAEEDNVEADIVTPVPDSGLSAALGYADASGLPFEWGLIRNHYVGRTFIEPEQSIRNFGVKLKLNPMKEFLADKRVVVVDDSLVRGTTSQKIVELIRRAGAKEVHMRISSPPITHPCFFGIDMPTLAELKASSNSVEEIRQFLRADSIRYLSLEGLLHCVHPNEEAFCTACFSGKYPIPVEQSDYQLSLFRESRTSEHRA